MNRLLRLSRDLPAPPPALTLAYTPIRLPMPGRQPLNLRLTAPVGTGPLPVLILSHGFGPSNAIPSKDGYAPLAQFWAERGLAVIQPTHASARIGGLDLTLPEGPWFWRERVAELRAILDGLDLLERLPGITGRLDRERIALAGHSFGGHTCSLAMGGQVAGQDFLDPRIRAGILLASPGRGGDLLPEQAARLSFLDVDFATIRVPTLVVCGQKDDPGHFTRRGPEWHADAYHDAPTAQALVTIHDVGHGLGGIAGLDAKETEIEHPDALEATRRLTLAWLGAALDLDPQAWPEALAALARSPAPLATVALKR